MTMHLEQKMIASADLVAEGRFASILGTDVFCVIQGVAYTGNDLNTCKARPVE